MGEVRHCCHCRSCFQRRPQNPDQQYCSRPECQRARKSAYQRRKLAEDEAYRDNQREAQRQWRGNNSGYWRDYRKRNPAYAEGNRERQKARNHRQRQDGVRNGAVAKMDVSSMGKALPSGRYRLSRVDDGKAGGVAKMDALIVEINVLSAGCG